MKLTKKLLPALGMMLLSTCMMVTSTFAWFSMNTEVSATGMQVTAKGDQVYLQIVKDTQSFVPGEAQTTVAAASNSTEYVPTNVYSSFSETNPGAFSGVADQDGKLNLVWVTATSNDPAYSNNRPGSGTDGADLPLTYSQVASASLASYAYKTSYKLRLDPDAGQVAGGKLKITGVAFDSNYAIKDGQPTNDSLYSCISVLIVCDAEKTAILYKQNTAGTFTPQTGSASALTANGFPANGVEKVVDIYVFFDGDNPNCTTKNVTDITYSVSVSFNVNKDA